MDIPLSGDAGIPPVIPHDVLVKQEQGQAVLIWAIGAFCIYGWELFLCFPKEYRLVWRKPMNIPSLIYLANRYFGLIEFCFVVSLTTNAWSRPACKHIFLIEPIGALISTILSQAILGSRVYAIFSRSKVLGYTFGAILIGEMVAGGLSTSNIYLSPPVTAGPPGSQLPCGVLTGPFGWLITYWTMPLLYDSLTFLLTAWKAYDLWKREVNTTIFNIIWRDGLLYFFANFTMNTVNVLIFVLAPESLRAFNLAPTIMFQVILSCRMFLNLKGSNDRPDSYIDRPKANDRLKFHSRSSSATVSNDNSNSLESSRPIAVDTKRATVTAQAYELDARVKPSHEAWDMA